MLSLKFRTTSKTNLNGLRKSGSILVKNVRAGMFTVGKRMSKSAASRMRRDSGANIRSLKINVKGTSLDLGVLVFSDRVSAFIDARGLPRGIFPPYREGTPLYNWAQRKARGLKSEQVKRYKVPKRTLHQLNSNFERRRKLRGVKRIIKKPRARAAGNKRVRALNAESRRIAFLAARAIFKKGIKATHWNSKALEANKTAMTREIKNSILRAINEMGRLK